LRPGKADAGVRPSPKSKELLLQQAARIVQDNTDATGPESAAVVALIQSEKRPNNLVGFLTALSRSDGELGAWLDQYRATQRQGDRETWLAYLDTLPGCAHGDAGGNVPDPAGWVRCPICRKQRAAHAA
jgi:hypothetical protein